MALHFTGLPGSEVDGLGFRRPSDLDREAYNAFWNAYLPVLSRRDRRWQKVGLPRGEKLKRFIRKGVPARLRPTIWFRKCPPTIEQEKHTVPEDVVEAIRMDLPRTYPDNERFAGSLGHRILGRILYAVAQYLPDIGYCQGFNYIAALLYLVLGNEAAAARLMVHAVSERRSYYSADMRGILTDVNVLRDILRERKMMPSSMIRLMEANMEMMFSKWLLFWYVETLPIETVLRIWDCFFEEGDCVLFKVAVTLIEASVPALSKCRTADDVLQFFNNIGSTPIAMDCHSLLKIAFASDKEAITNRKLDERRKLLEAPCSA